MHNIPNFKINDKVRVSRMPLSNNGWCGGSSGAIGSKGVISNIRDGSGEKAHIDIKFDDGNSGSCYQPYQLDLIREDGVGVSSIITLGVLGLLGYAILNKSKKTQTNAKRSTVRKVRK